MKQMLKLNITNKYWHEKFSKIIIRSLQEADRVACPVRSTLSYWKMKRSPDTQHIMAAAVQTAAHHNSRLRWLLHQDQQTLGRWSSP